MTSQTTNRGSTVILADGSGVTQIGTTMSRFVDGFAGGAFAAGAASIAALTNASGQWDVVRSTLTSMTVTLNNGSLVIGCGTTNGDEVLLLGRSYTTIPQNLLVTATLSQRIAGNEIRFGYAEVNDAGQLITNPNLANFPRNSASLMFNGTSSTSASLEAIEDGIAAIKSVSVTGLTTASSTDYSIEARPEDITGSAQNADSTALRVGTGARISSVVPNSNVMYRPFIWIRNVAAPASNTNVTINRVVSMDVQEVQAEIGGGRGNMAASQAIPVALVSGGSSIALTGSSVTTGSNAASSHKLISAATVNATNAKASVGRIMAGMVTNTSASMRYLKLFNKAFAPVVGTDTPFMCIPLLPGVHTSLAMVAGPVYGLSFSTGISYAIVGGDADLDATAIGASEVYVNLVIA